MTIEGKVAIVTGGGSGIGAALVQRFARAGAAAVVAADIDEDRAAAVAESVGPPAASRSMTRSGTGCGRFTSWRTSGLRAQ